MTLVQDWLEAAAEQRPDHTFLETPTERVGFAALDGRARRIAGALKELGLERQRIAVRPANDVESVAAIFAVPRVGEMVLINARLTAEEISAQLAEAQVTALLSTGQAGAVTGLESMAIESLDAAPAPVVAPEPDRVHSVVFTSGSSGMAKGVRLSWANLEASASGSARHLRHGPDDRWLAVLPIYHIGGLQVLIRSAREATSVVLEPAFDEARVAALMKDGQVTLASMVSQMVSRLLDLDSGSYDSVRAVLVGGGPLARGLVARAAESGLTILPTYGMTETASQIATARPNDPPERRMRVFAIPGAEVRCTPQGLIQVRGPMVFRGYLGEPDRDPGQWFTTGDVGEMDGEGGLVVVGRADDVIVTGGENVHPSEVEGVLGTHPQVVEVAVVGVEDPRWGRRVVAVYVGEAAPGELERYARFRLAGFKIPKQWVRMDELPRTSIGKVDRLSLLQVLAGGSPSA